MFDLHDVVLSIRDAAALSAVVADWPARDPSEQAAADVLADAVSGARVVSRPHGRDRRRHARRNRHLRRAAPTAPAAR